MPSGEIRALCQRLGVSRSTYYSRLRRGWDYQRVVSLGPGESRRAGDSGVDVNQVLREWKRRP